MRLVAAVLVVLYLQSSLVLCLQTSLTLCLQSSLALSFSRGRAKSGFKGLHESSFKRHATSTRLYSGSNGENDDVMSKFVPVFFGVWAFGYTAISFVDISGGGLGDTGGYIGAGFAVVLLLALVGAAAYETFRDYE